MRLSCAFRFVRKIAFAPSLLSCVFVQVYHLVLKDSCIAAKPCPTLTSTRTRMFAHSVYTESRNDRHDYHHHCWCMINPNPNLNLHLMICLT